MIHSSRISALNKRTTNLSIKQTLDIWLVPIQSSSRKTNLQLGFHLEINGEDEEESLLNSTAKFSGGI